VGGESIDGGGDSRSPCGGGRNVSKSEFERRFFGVGQLKGRKTTIGLGQLELGIEAGRHILEPIDNLRICDGTFDAEHAVKTSMRTDPNGHGEAGDLDIGLLVVQPFDPGLSPTRHEFGQPEMPISNIGGQELSKGRCQPVHTGMIDIVPYRPSGRLGTFTGGNISHIVEQVAHPSAPSGDRS
jgi:hypothetical protein